MIQSFYFDLEQNCALNKVLLDILHILQRDEKNDRKSKYFREKYNT